MTLKYSQNLGETNELAGSPVHNVCFWDFLSKKVFETNHNFRQQRVTNLKKIKTLVSISKVDITTVPLFFLISYSLVHKLKICLEILFGQKT